MKSSQVPFLPLGIAAVFVAAITSSLHGQFHQGDQARRERFRVRGPTNDEGPAGSFERSGRKVSPGVEITEAPTGFDNLTNGFDGQGRPFEEINEDTVVPLRCYVHFLRNALDYLPRKGGDDLVELRWLYGRRDAEEARRDLAAWLLRWQEKYPKLCTWVEENIEETLTFYRLPREHHKHLKSTNMLERLNQELKRRTQVIRIFPNEESALRLIRALAVEIHETGSRLTVI